MAKDRILRDNLIRPIPYSDGVKVSITDWVMFLSNEIDRTKRDQPPIMTALIAAILAIMGVGVTVAVMCIPESLYYHKLMFLFIISIFIVFFGFSHSLFYCGLRRK